MRLLFDTSMLVASLVETHPQHSVALQALKQMDPPDVRIVAAHSLAEIYATLTRLPPPLRMSSHQAFGLIEKNILSTFEIVSLFPSLTIWMCYVISPKTIWSVASSTTRSFCALG